MCKEKNEKWQKRFNDEHAAHLLMTEFVKREADHIARALESIIPLRHEISYDSLEKNMGVVNQTFASIALQLIHHNSGLEPGDPDSLHLPVGAKTMGETIEDLSKFIHSVRTLLWVLQEQFADDKALGLADQVFFEYEPQL